MSRTQVQRLGERLAAGSEDDADRQALEELIACHLAIIEVARPRVDNLSELISTGSLHISHRAKTTTTIIEKLQRESGMSLARMQDLAGIRIVGGITEAEQDSLAAEIVRRFPPAPRVARIVDRRAQPRYGYRAVHVVVCLDGISIEIQVRTLVQHMWADCMERIADRLGRDIRYGDPPSRLPEGMSKESAEELVAGMMHLSGRLAERMADRAGPVDVAARLDEYAAMIWNEIADLFESAGS